MRSNQIKSQEAQFHLFAVFVPHIHAVVPCVLVGKVPLIKETSHYRMETSIHGNHISLHDGQHQHQHHHKHHGDKSDHEIIHVAKISVLQYKDTKIPRYQRYQCCSTMISVLPYIMIMAILIMVRSIPDNPDNGKDTNP